jgi:hypothetical protein
MQPASSTARSGRIDHRASSSNTRVDFGYSYPRLDLQMGIPHPWVRRLHKCSGPVLQRRYPIVCTRGYYRSCCDAVHDAVQVIARIPWLKEWLACGVEFTMIKTEMGEKVVDNTKNA